MTDSIERFARPSTAIGMFVLICSSLGWSVIRVAETRVVMLAIGIPFTLLATIGWLWVEPRGSRVIAGWLATLSALTLGALYVTDMGMMLMVIACIGLAVIYFGITWGVIATSVVLACNVIYAMSWGLPPIRIYEVSTGFVPGAVFAIVIGRLIVRERDARQQLRRYTMEAEELAATRERNRIAREIHDSVGHYLTVVNVQIEAARATQSADHLDRAQELARQGLAELRRSVSMLRANEQRPVVALKELDDDLIVEGTPRPLTPAIEFTLFRAAQEAITNAARHANATHVTCTLRYRADEVSIAVSDDGVGTTSTDGGFGLVGLRERAHLVGGTVDIATSPGRGFTLELRIPT
ncbi:MAG: sensor histidine kinase [Kofleriaceae bacterium]